MNLKKAFLHLVDSGWMPPNRMFLKRFSKGEISDTRIRTILTQNKYSRICQEKWQKNKNKPNFKHYVK